MPLSPRTLRPSSTFTPKSISGLALWLDGSDANSLYTTDAGAVTAVSSPTEISGCALWLDASDASSITESGGLVSQWNDKSGNARHATATTTARPTTGTRTVGGRNALDFNGTSNVMTLGGTVIPTAATHTVFLVYQLDTASQSRFSTLLSSSPAGDQEMRVVGFGSTAIDFYFNGNLGRFLTTTAIGLGPVVFSAREATKSVRSAGAGVFSTGSGDAYAWASNPITLGGRLSANWMDGLLCEVIIFSSTLSDADTSRVEAYLAQRWGISNVHVPATAASDPVGYWGDKSGNARHATQSTAASRPTISATNQGGRKALAFASQSQTVVSPATVAQYVADATTLPKMFFAWVARPEGGAASVVFGSPTHPNNASRVFYASDFGAAGNHIVDFGSVSTARLTGTVGNEANNVGHVYSAFRDGAVMSVRRDGVEILRKTDTTGGYTDTTGTLSINTTSGGSATSSWMEFMAYAASMPAANITRLERYLAAKWGITLAPQVANADAQNWIDRVYANGGTVTSATASAVNTFCSAIDAAGIRDRFYRMGIFAGSNLNAALVPLYRGPSLGGTQYGNTTDTNVGPFVSGDYAETGASGGLTPNGVGTKRLDTGLTQTALGVDSCHLSVYEIAKPNAGASYRVRVGSRGASAAHEHLLTNAVAEPIVYGCGANSSSRATASSYAESGAFWLGSNTTATSSSLFKNGLSAGAGSPATRTAQNVPYFVFALNDNGSLGDAMITGRLGAYSIGLGMTSGQAAAYYTAMQAFQTALGRNV